MKKSDKIKLFRGKSKAFVFANLTRQNVFPCAEKLIDLLLKNKIETYMVPEAKEHISNSNIIFSEPENILSQVDIVFIIGGDGTILRAAKHAIKYDKPIIGINAGRLGFLSDIEAESLFEIEKLFKSGCPIEKRTVLEIENGENKTLAINDVFVSKSVPGKIAELFVECNGHEVCRYRADGIVLSTPDGSTAYSMSAGGPVLDTNLNAIIMTPVCPHSLISCSVVFSPEKIITVGSSLIFGEKELDVVVDGEKVFELSKDEKITIKCSEKSVKFINLSGRGFYEILNQKIIGRR
ncbi:MAG: NAD(+)/NADH kinase [Oscillospiraceae bacterium]|nr:NAD(+)/NADH kinase [Oscillospiraceae bacterium]MBR3962922.1 NAD(+)/NADH kinase [Oscillospiraceae bacterium]